MGNEEHALQRKKPSLGNFSASNGYRGSGQTLAKSMATSKIVPQTIAASLAVSIFTVFEKRERF
jgi:hypothetical protein